MKKILVVFAILVAFISGGLTTHYYDKINNKPIPVAKVVKAEIFTIDKTSFDTYSKTLLVAINKCSKEEKRLDVKAEHDLINYIDIYFGADFKNIMKDMTEEQKNTADDVRLTSLNLTYLLEAIQDNDKKGIEVQHKILIDLLIPYKL